MKMSTSIDKNGPVLENFEIPSETQIYQSSVCQNLMQERPEIHNKNHFFGKYSFYLLIVLSFLILLSIVIDSTFIISGYMQTMKKMRELEEMLNADMKLYHEADQSLQIPVNKLHEESLDKIVKLESIFLKLGTAENGEEKEYFNQIQSVYRDPSNTSTILNLYFGHKLIANSEYAILYDENDQTIGTITFGLDDQYNFENVDKDDNKRLLYKKNNLGRYPQNMDPGLPMSAQENYCRYGCGKMAVTFPYYYRPFFGYGFPLIGTESFFPQGYGGYPAAGLIAGQAQAHQIGGLGGGNIIGGGGIPMMSNVAPPIAP